MQGVLEVLTICPPVRAKFPVAELLFGCTAMLNIPILPFSDNCKVRLRTVPTAPTKVAVATAKLSKQFAPIVKFRFEMLTDAEGAAGVIIIGPSFMLKVKLSIGEDMVSVIPPMDEDMVPPIVAVATALKFPERLLLITLA